MKIREISIKQIEAGYLNNSYSKGSIEYVRPLKSTVPEGKNLTDMWDPNRIYSSDSTGKVSVTEGQILTAISEYKSDLDAYLYVPEISDVDVPVIIYLRGGLNLEKSTGASITNESLPKFLNNKEVSVNAVVVAPRVPSANITNLLDKLAANYIYDIDMNRISITGYSTGAHYALEDIKYDKNNTFSAAAIMALRYSGSQYDLKYVKCPAKFIFEQNHSSDGPRQVAAAITSEAKKYDNIEIVQTQGTNHGTVTNYYKTSDILEWLISQSK